MKSRLNNERGFTLIELVMVIVILGILAAVAIPRFVDLQGSARTSVRDGITGALAGQITMLHAQYLISSTNYSAAAVAASIDSSGLTTGLTAPTTTQISAGIDGQTFTWTYGPNTSVAAATITPD